MTTESQRLVLMDLLEDLRSKVENAKRTACNSYADGGTIENILKRYRHASEKSSARLMALQDLLGVDMKPSMP